MRCFLACDLPTPIRRIVSQLITELSRQFPPHAVRWVQPSHTHLTLHFLGNDVSAPMVRAIQHEAPRITTAVAALTLTLTQVHRLPPTGASRILYLGCGGTAVATLRILRERLGELLIKLGLPLDTRPWQPHVTLGRVRSAVPIPPAPVQVPPEQFSVNEVVLYRSQLTPDGPAYEPLGKFPLADRGYR